MMKKLERFDFEEMKQPDGRTQLVIRPQAIEDTLNKLINKVNEVIDALPKKRTRKR